MNEEAQLNYFSQTAVWLDAEKKRLLAIIRAGRESTRAASARHRAWKALMEISDRTAQLNRQFEKFLSHSTPDAP